MLFRRRRVSVTAPAPTPTVPIAATPSRSRSAPVVGRPELTGPVALVTVVVLPGPVPLRRGDRRGAVGLAAAGRRAVAAWQPRRRAVLAVAARAACSARRGSGTSGPRTERRGSPEAWHCSPWQPGGVQSPWQMHGTHCSPWQMHVWSPHGTQRSLWQLHTWSWTACSGHPRRTAGCSPGRRRGAALATGVGEAEHADETLQTFTGTLTGALMVLPEPRPTLPMPVTLPLLPC